MRTTASDGKQRSTSAKPSATLCGDAIHAPQTTRCYIDQEILRRATGNSNDELVSQVTWKRADSHGSAQVIQALDEGSLPTGIDHVFGKGVVSVAWIWFVPGTNMTSKSPRKVRMEAFEVAIRSFVEYAHAFGSKKKSGNISFLLAFSSGRFGMRTIEADGFLNGSFAQLIDCSTGVKRTGGMKPRCRKKGKWFEAAHSWKLPCDILRKSKSGTSAYHYQVNFPILLKLYEQSVS